MIHSKHTQLPMQPQHDSFLVSLFSAFASVHFHMWTSIIGNVVGTGLTYAAAITAILSGIVTMSPSLRVAVDAKFKKWFNL